jgi:hypothetical protein
MKQIFASSVLSVAMLGVLAGTSIASADDDHAAGGHVYNVTVTNLTRGESFTPILVASHRHGNFLFTVGEPASSELAALAEGGDTVPLESMLKQNPSVAYTATSSGLLEPGQSVTVSIKAGARYKYISMAAMLIPTNDGFFSVQNIPLPRDHNTRTVVSPAYDAGSEPNDELCASIPGPVCGGAGGSPEAGGEGYVHIHGGIHGIGDLVPAERDWRNPVAEIVIQRAQ